MIKKFLTLFLTFVFTVFSFSTALAAEKFTLNDNKWEISVNWNTIFVWKVEKNTSIIDLFSELKVNGTLIDEVINVLDVRYVTPANEDHKIQQDTDIIDNGSKVYVLFKTTDKDGEVAPESKISFTTKNLKLEEIWNVSNTENNSYNKIFEVVNKAEAEVKPDLTVKEEPKVEKEEKLEEKEVDKKILKENNTGIKDLSTSQIILLILLTIFSFSFYVFKRKE